MLLLLLDFSTHFERSPARRPACLPGRRWSQMTSPRGAGVGRACQQWSAIWRAVAAVLRLFKLCLRELSFDGFISHHRTLFSLPLFLRSSRLLSLLSNQQASSADQTSSSLASTISFSFFPVSALYETTSSNGRLLVQQFAGGAGLGTSREQQLFASPAAAAAN